ncbi:MAG: AAA family ATPase [Chitinivibrionales bacterium]
MGWKNESNRKPLLLRGARQVGKTYIVREFAKQFKSYTEVNFELLPQAIQIFELDLQPERIIRDLSILLEQRIEPGKTLLFFDEIQRAPKAIAALRYFYEMMPNLHVVAAGSLIDFALEKIGLPVGRISTVYMHPLNFIEFLAAKKSPMLFEALINSGPTKPLSLPVHEKMLGYLAEYLAVGGMPAAVHQWLTSGDINKCVRIHAELLETYQQDFPQYSKKYQQEYVETVFNELPLCIGKKFKFSSIASGQYKKRELGPSLDLLVKAGVVHKIIHSSGQGIPLGASADPEKFKIIFLDCALAQKALGAKAGQWLIDSQAMFINKGEIAESFVGQELVAASPDHEKSRLYYWHREARSSNAEVDYLFQIDNKVIPIEVKSGAVGALRSMHTFLRDHPLSPYGIRFSTGNYSIHDRIYSCPLYSAGIMAGLDRSAMEYLAA